MRRTIALFALAAVAALAACSPAELKGGARVVRAAAQELKAELRAAVDAGELTAADAAVISPLLEETASRAGSYADDPRDFAKLTSAEKRRLVSDFIKDMTDSVERLEQQGVFRVKNERGRKKFEQVVRNIRRGISIARVVEAALPPPAPSPSSQPAQ